MDAIDIQIVQLLRFEGRLSHEEIARRVNLSRPAIHERVKRLEQHGVIRGYSTRVDWSVLGYPLMAFIWVQTSHVDPNVIGQRLLSLKCKEALVEEGHRVTGEWCLLLKARAESPLALQTMIDQVRGVPGVTGTMTTLALSAIEEDNGDWRELP